MALAAAFMLIWVNLAVGIIGDEDNPHNAVYFCEVLLAAATAFAATLRPTGMSRAMLATGGFQLLVTALAAYDGWGASNLRVPRACWSSTSASRRCGCSRRDCSGNPCGSRLEP